MPDQQTPQPVQFGTVRAVVTLPQYNPPVVFMLDTKNVGIATGNITETLFESLRQNLATALGPEYTQPKVPRPEHFRAAAQAEEEEERGKGKKKGKKNKGKGRPEWAGDPDHPDHPRNRVKPEKPEEDEEHEEPDTPDEPEDEDEIPVEPLPDVIDPDTLEPVEGDVDVRDPGYEPVTVNTTAEIVPALFEQWAAEKYSTLYGPEGTHGYPDPATHPDLVREYLNDQKA